LTRVVALINNETLGFLFGELIGVEKWLITYLSSKPILTGVGLIKKENLDLLLGELTGAENWVPNS
jgi:hypothetical protein